MKTILLLEHDDLARLKGGEVIDLTPQLSLSLQGRIGRVRPRQTGEAPPVSLKEEQAVRRFASLAKRRAYNAIWRKKHPGAWRKYQHTAEKKTRINSKTPVNCKRCGREFRSGQALGGHINACKGKAVTA